VTATTEYRAAKPLSRNAVTAEARFVLIASQNAAGIRSAVSATIIMSRIRALVSLSEPNVTHSQAAALGSTPDQASKPLPCRKEMFYKCSTKSNVRNCCSGKLNVEIIISQPSCSIFFHGLEMTEPRRRRVPPLHLLPKQTLCFLGTTGRLCAPQIPLGGHAVVGLQHVQLFAHGFPSPESDYLTGRGPAAIRERDARRSVGKLDEMTWRFDNRKNPFLFRDTLLKLIATENLEYKELTAKAA
jgi:hypothetical protein